VTPRPPRADTAIEPLRDSFDEDPTEPFVQLGPRELSSPWATPRPVIVVAEEEIDFEGAIESLTETQPIDWEE
jgi:hypothetical protein